MDKTERILEMAKRGKRVGEILGLRLGAFDPGYSYAPDGKFDFGSNGNINIPEIAVNQIYQQALEIELLKTKIP